MEYVILIILVVLVVALFVVSYMKKKKYNTELGEMRAELKVGDKVMTDTGVVGTVVDSYEEEGYKYFVLKSGKGNNVGCFSVHANAIYYVFGKEEKKTTNNIAEKQFTPVEKQEEPKTENDEVNAETKIDGEVVKKPKTRTTKKK